MRDYDKFTIDRLAYLENKIKKLEGKKDEFVETEFEFDEDLGLEIEKECLFEVIKEGIVKLVVSGNVNQNITLFAYINDVLLAKFQTNNGEIYVNRELRQTVGEKNLKLVITSQTQVTLRDFKVSLKGYVKKKNSNYSLSVANFENYSVIAFSGGSKVEVLRYDGVLEKKFVETAEQACISKSGDSAMLCKLVNKSLIVRKIDYYGDLVGESVTIQGGITTISGSNGNALFCVYAIKAGMLYRFDIAHDFSFNCVLVGHRAEKIVCSPDVYRSCIITDFNGNSKLIVQE